MSRKELLPGQGAHDLTVSGCGVASAIIVPGIIAATGRKLSGREGNTGEHFAGVFRAAAGAVTAFLGGQTVVQYRNNKLGVPLQTDDGELTQSDEQPTIFTGQYQFVVE